MVLLDVLGQRWTLRVLWELRDAPSTFRDLQRRCEDVSPTTLNRRLKELRSLKLVDHGDEGYVLTALGRQLGAHLTKLSAWSERWAKTL
ncbi:MAG: helix-turn-helix domain-containing protein [Myxococcota bacterium]